MTNDAITPEQADLIRTSPMFFVASVAPNLSDGPDGQGPVNLSPKGATPLHVVSREARCGRFRTELDRRCRSTLRGSKLRCLWSACAGQLRRFRPLGFAELERLIESTQSQRIRSRNFESRRFPALRLADACSLVRNVRLDSSRRTVRLNYLAGLLGT